VVVTVGVVILFVWLWIDVAFLLPKERDATFSVSNFSSFFFLIFLSYFSFFLPFHPSFFVKDQFNVNRPPHSSIFFINV